MCIFTLHYINVTVVCRSNQIQCNNGSCISNTRICDGTPDCPDGADEHNCCKYNYSPLSYVLILFYATAMITYLCNSILLVLFAISKANDITKNYGMNIVANLLREIIMVRDHFLTLPQWFTRDDIDDIIFGISVL